MPRRLAKFSSLFALRISTCCSSLRRRSSSGLKVLFALKLVRRCSGMYRSAIFAVAWVDVIVEWCFLADRQEEGGKAMFGRRSVRERRQGKKGLCRDGSSGLCRAKVKRRVGAARVGRKILIWFSGRWEKSCDDGGEDEGNWESGRVKRESGSKKWKVQGPATTQWGCVRSSDFCFALSNGSGQGTYYVVLWEVPVAASELSDFFLALAFDGGAI